MIRVAAIGDVHFSEDSRGRFRQHWSELHHAADVFLIAGDLTTHGSPEQVKVLVDEMQDIQIPIVAVLGNHDYHEDQADTVRHLLEEGGVLVIEGESVSLTVGREKLGVAGTKGFGGGFQGACASAFGEPEMKAFIRHTEVLADRMADELSRLECDYRVALLHYAPVKETLSGERLEIYPFLGSYLLAEAIDSAGADLALHGHAHRGKEKGLTAGGIAVRNVALPVLRHAYAIYHLDRDARPSLTSRESARCITVDVAPSNPTA